MHIFHSSDNDLNIMPRKCLCAISHLQEVKSLKWDKGVIAGLFSMWSETVGDFLQVTLDTKTRDVVILASQ